MKTVRSVIHEPFSHSYICNNKYYDLNVYREYEYLIPVRFVTSDLDKSLPPPASEQFRLACFVKQFNAYMMC